MAGAATVRKQKWRRRLCFNVARGYNGKQSCITFKPTKAARRHSTFQGNEEGAGRGQRAIHLKAHPPQWIRFAVGDGCDGPENEQRHTGGAVLHDTPTLYTQGE